ncbi:hypothetical protein [Heyndrickxia sporothermodurans]|uniref:hypothetical protein n=1 Tax=Heyndrickxia sporothermodurans TaxID=46224 RepID=UPI0035D715E2
MNDIFVKLNDNKGNEWIAVAVLEGEEYKLINHQLGEGWEISESLGKVEDLKDKIPPYDMDFMDAVYVEKNYREVKKS